MTVCTTENGGAAPSTDVDVLQLHGCQRLPVAATSASVEELDARIRNAERTVGELLLVLETQEVSTELLLRDLIRASFAVVG